MLFQGKPDVDSARENQTAELLESLVTTKSIDRICTERRARHFIRGGALAIVLWAASFVPALADTWTSAFVPAAVSANDYSGTLVVFVVSNQALINPAGCAVTDDYATDDMIVTNQTYAGVLSAVATGAQIQLDIASSGCAANRPKIIAIRVSG